MLISTRAAVGGLLMLCMPAAFAGRLEAEPFVSFKLQRDNNVFLFQDKQEALQVNGTSERADTLYNYGAGIALQYSYGLQRAFLGGEIHRIDYQNFNRLDHDANKIRGGLDWKIGSIAYGHLLAQEERRLESFVGRQDNALGLQRETKLGFDGTLPVTPRWALQTTVSDDILRNSLQESRNYDLNETTTSFGGLYTGQPVAQAGAFVEYVHGDYPQREGDLEGLSDHYDQTSLKLTASWQPSDLSSLLGEAGYTHRDNGGEGVPNFSGFTGRLAYQRKWSGKTLLRAEVFRRVNSVGQIDVNYVAETGAGAGIDWQIATKLGLFGTYEYLHDDYQGSPDLDVGGVSELDKIQHLELGLKYQPVRWLTVTPSGTFDKRDSNRAENSYNDLIVGVEVEARLPAADSPLSTIRR